MSTRDYVNIVAQTGPETVAEGTAAVATVRHNSVKITAEPKQERESVTAQGSRFPTLVYTKKEWAEGSIEGVPCFRELPDLLVWAVGNPTVTQVPGEQVFLHEWDNISNGYTRTVEFGDSVQAAQIPGCFITSLEFEFGRNSGTSSIKASFTGGQWNDSHTLTAGISPVVNKPVEPSQVNIYVDDSFAALGTTKQADVLSVTVSLSDLRAPDWRLDASKASISGSVDTAATGEVSFTVEATTAGRALLSALRSGSTKYVRIEAVGGNTGVVGEDFTFVLDFAIAVTEHTRGETDGVYVATTTATIVEDSTGFSFAALVNTDVEADVPVV